MMKFIQAIQWLLVIAVLLFFLGIFGGMLLMSMWRMQPQTIVNAAISNLISSTPTSIQPLSTSTRTPFQPLPTNTRTPTFWWSLTPTATITFTATITSEPTQTLEPTFTLEPSFTPIIIESIEENSGESLPSEVYLAVSGFGQSYALDCEARSAVDLAAYFGIQIDEQEFLDMLPRSDDPEEGFVGSYWDAIGQIPPASYGVHAPPVARLLRSYGLNAWEQKGMSWDSLKWEIASGRPVMAWVVGNTGYGHGVSYTAPSTGNSTIVAYYEHTVLVTGYSPEAVNILDPNSAMVYQRSLSQFLDSWAVLGNMAIIVEQ